MNSTGQILISLAGIQFVGAVDSGPNTALVLKNAFHSRKLGIATTIGFWLGGTFLSSLALFGIGTVLTDTPQLTAGLYIICGCYLIWLGFMSFRHSFIKENAFTHIQPNNTNIFKAILSGSITSSTNPKTIVTLMSVFVATQATSMPFADQILAILMMQAISFIWYGSLTFLVSSLVVRRFLENQRHWLDRIAGTVMFGFGVKLLSALVL